MLASRLDITGRAAGMKLAAIENSGQAGLAAQIDDYLVDISPIFSSPMPDIGALLVAGWDTRLAEIRRYAETAPVSARLTGEVVFRPPVARPGKIICLGLNYRDHARESGMPIPEHMVVFLRAPTSLAAHQQAIPISPLSRALDFEGELAVIVGRRARRVSPAQALDHVFGYSIFNDLSYRDYQLRTPQWTIGKNFDGTGPFGPIVVTADALPSGAKGLRVITRVNGAVVQNGSTSDMIFDVATAIADLSDTMTLEPGDVIVTGTPAGVGGARKPPLWLKAGDICEVEIERIGTLVNRIT